MPVSCSIPLPDNFRSDDFLHFYHRDESEIAEQVRNGCVRKGLSWQGMPASLELDFKRDRVVATLAVDGDAGDPETGFESRVQRILGLSQAVEAFEAQYRDHPDFGPLVRRQAGLRIAVTATPFEALSWAIIGQQISVRAATAIRRRLILAVGPRHSSGLYCYPDAERLVNVSVPVLRAAGLSTTKAETLLALSRVIADGRLVLDLPTTAESMASLYRQLNAIRGIGPWTANYTLLRGYGWLDGSLEGDVAVRRALQQLLGSDRKVTAAEAKDWLAAFAPWRALAAAHLWASLTETAF